MNLQISVDPNVGYDLESIVNRHVNYELSTFQSTLGSLNVKVAATSQPSILCSCRVSASLENGGEIDIETVSADPRVGIVDALARFRRELAREDSLRVLN